MNRPTSSVSSVVFLGCILAFGLCAVPYNQEPAIWNVLKNRTVALNPADASCVLGEKYCVPDPTNQLQSTNRCLQALCSAQNRLVSAMTDGNIATSFVTKNLNQLEITADLNGVYEVFYIRLAFSGNPPSSIVVQRKATLGAEWTPWQYYAINCLTSFGMLPDQAPTVPNAVQCNSLPWSNNPASVTSSVVWNVLSGRPGAAENISNRFLQDFLSASVVRITLAGHLFSLPPSGTTYDVDVYRIADITLAGRCGKHYLQTTNNTCEFCDCDAAGSTSATCSPQGTCTCRTNYHGKKCDTCNFGFFNVSSGCFPCSCNELGSQAEVCDGVTGRCTCRPGFSGPTCGECQRGTYLLGHLCAPCDCNRVGSLDELCDRNGTCMCKRFVTGTRCDVCLDGFIDLSNASPYGCSQRQLPTIPVVLSFDPEENHTIALRQSSVINSMEHNMSVVLGGLTVTGTKPYANDAIFYPWLIAITVLLIIALIVLLIHFIMYIRRRSWQKTYSPRQVPDFLSTETDTKHPDYGQRAVRPTSAKLTGYFYNPEYPTGALTPGNRSQRPRRSEQDDDLDEFDDVQVSQDVNGTNGTFRRNPIDLSREPPSSGVLPFRPHTYQRSPRQDKIRTVSGGIVNENFNLQI